MSVRVKLGDPLAARTAAILFGVGEGAPLRGELAALDRKLGGVLKLLAEDDWKGKLEQTVVLPTLGKLPARRVAFVGLGKLKELTEERLRRAAGAAARSLQAAGAQTVAAAFPELGPVKPAVAARALAEGWALALYAFTAFKTEPKPRLLPRLTLLAARRAALGELAAAVRAGEIVTEATALARELANLPGNAGTPRRLAAEAARAARKWGFRARALGPAALEKLGMGALLGVAQGSHEPARFIILEVPPRGRRAARAARRAPTVVLVGKGITFDSGGISIKPSASMEEMRHDKSGAAAVIGACAAAARLKLPLRVVGLVPAAENMPGGGASRPGDVLRSLSGKTIEIISTDAEGRLILADALAYAARYQPAAVIDLATLTGACHVALGRHCSGLFGTDRKLVAALVAAGEASGERLWELPLWEEYGAEMKSEFADLKNAGEGRGGGACTAAAFLQKFVGEYPWAHLDIAGTAYDVKRSYNPAKGANGMGVRLLVQYLRGLAGRGE